jgi:outer membrane protein assembly factor BamB
LFFNDYIFEPSENGLIYSFKLNAHYEDDELTIAPDEFVKLQYHTYRSSEKKYWLGMEDSPVVWENYLYIADNGGTLLCIDMNTMKIIWAQDVVDDTNGSPVLSIEEGHPYLYIGTSLHWSPSRYLRLGYCPFFKIDALNGEYVWIRDYYCNTIAGISGGVQSSPILGENDIKDLIIFPVARTPSVMDGKLVALDIHTGKEIWSTHMKNYAWSSPVVSYDETGNSLIVQCDSGGMMHLIRGVDGKIIDSLSLGANIEATPAMMGDRIVVGTRGQKIYGVSIR